MKTFFGVFAILVLMSGGLAVACPPQPSNVLLPPLPPVTIAGGMYYCANSQAPAAVGDLSYNEWAKHVQVCNTRCSYEAMIPTDPHSLLIPTSCGSGMHETTYLVEPPPAPAKGPGSLHIASTGCSGLAPAKAAAPPKASPQP